MGQVIVVAPDPELRQSVRFALEAEGYSVATCTSIREVPELPAILCAVLDHHAATGDLGDLRGFFRRFHPVVLLANLTGHPLEPLSFRTVLKPMLGRPLTEAVAAAIASRADPK